jgi:hypothetical protein
MAVKSKHAGFRVSGLGMRGHAPHLNKPKAKRSPPFHCFSALVHACSKAEPVLEMKSPEIHWIGNPRSITAPKKDAAQ